MLVDLALLGTIFGMVNNREDAAWACSRDMVVWLYVFAGFLGAMFVYHLLHTLCFGVRRRPSALCRLIVDVIAAIILGFFGIAWLIYGNYLVWHRDYYCRYQFLNNPAAKIWKLFAAVIIIFYVWFLLQALIWLIFCCLCCAGCRNKRKGSVPKFCLCLPWIGACTSQHKADYPERDLTHCGICD